MYSTTAVLGSAWSAFGTVCARQSAKVLQACSDNAPNALGNTQHLCETSEEFLHINDEQTGQ